MYLSFKTLNLSNKENNPCGDNKMIRLRYKEMNTSSVDRGPGLQSSEEADENVVNSGRNDPEMVFVNNVTGGDVIEYFD